MFARPYAPSEPAERTAPVSPRRTGSRSTNSKHYKLFRTLPLGAQLPSSSVLPHSYTNARPASASAHYAPPSPSPVTYGGSVSMPLSPVTPFAPTQVQSPASPAYFQTPAHPSPPPAVAPPTPRSGAASLSSPRRRPASAQQSARGAGAGAAAQAYQAAFLSALQERQASESDRLTLFNRLQHLRAAEEKAARQIEATAAQIRAVHSARERHARDAAERKANEDWWAAERARAAQHRRAEHEARKQAFRVYKDDMKQLRRSQAHAQRVEQRELVEARAHIAAEELAKHQLVRADLLERTRMFHAREAMRHAHEAARVLQAKALKIQLEQARRAAAEDDLLRMEREESELLERAKQTAELHQRTLDELASLVLVEQSHATLRATYTPIPQLQGRVARASSARKHRGGTAASATAAAAAQSSGTNAAAAHAAATAVPPSSLSSLTLSLPSAQLQQRIFTSSGFPSAYATPRHDDEEKQQTHTQQEEQHTQQRTQQEHTALSPHSSPSHSARASQPAGPDDDDDGDGDGDGDQDPTDIDQELAAAADATTSGDDAALSAHDHHALHSRADEPTHAHH